jgi:hypothetical protein
VSPASRQQPKSRQPNRQRAEVAATPALRFGRFLPSLRPIMPVSISLSYLRLSLWSSPAKPTASPPSPWSHLRPPVVASPAKPVAASPAEPGRISGQARGRIPAKPVIGPPPGLWSPSGLRSHLRPSPASISGRACGCTSGQAQSGETASGQAFCYLANHARLGLWSHLRQAHGICRRSARCCCGVVSGRAHCDQAGCCLSGEFCGGVCQGSASA